MTRDVRSRTPNCALASGATHVDTTVLGIGERNGITPLGGLVACLIVADRECIVGKYRIDRLGYVEHLVAQAVEVEIPFNNCNLSSFAEARIKKPQQAPGAVRLSLPVAGSRN